MTIEGLVLAARPHFTRARLWDTGVALVEDLQSTGVRTTRPPRNYTPQYKVCLPYAGAFVWRVGGDEVVGDANQVLFVTAGEEFEIGQVLAGPYAELILTLSPCLATELAGTDETRLASHPLFRRRSQRAEPALQLRLARFLSGVRRGALDRVAIDEAVLDLLRRSFASAPLPAITAARRRLVERTKAFLVAHYSRPLRLEEIAQAVDASPSYLTTAFRQIEGAPLHRYLTQLRLARALVELPHTADLSMLALGLGFSSHSHFSSAFRQAFGASPSAVRRGLRI